ncbi:hypothetical protein B0H14DRAFT_3537195 [Mycena olivaceomarginata]|nr:hypothetical protein B0H14DRAFT_3537195 [Mycena olivaceomarginata]
MLLQLPLELFQSFFELAFRADVVVVGAVVTASTSVGPEPRQKERKGVADGGDATCSINGCTSVGRRGWRSSAAAPDFGLAIVTDATLDTTSTTQRGSCRWMAPELYDPQLEPKKRTKASDVMPSHFCV